MSEIERYRDALRDLAVLAERMAAGPAYVAAGIVWPGGEKPGEGVCQAKALVQAKELLGVPYDEYVETRAIERDLDEPPSSC
jgi:hypothetical protein